MYKDIFVNKITESKPSKFNNSIVFSVDEGYLPYAIFVANQIIELENNLTFDITICLPDINIVPNKLLESNIRFIEINIKGLEALPFGRLSLSAYHRLFLPELLQEDYQYLVYLDADTFIRKPFTESLLEVIGSFNKDFSVAASPDIIEIQSKTFKIKKNDRMLKYLYFYHNNNHIYRNSGVLVINSDNYLKNNIREKVISYAFNNIDKLNCHDQSALNGALLADIALLPFNYNYQMHKLTVDLVEEFQPYILHFIGDNKPWVVKNFITESYYSKYLNFYNSDFLEHKIEVLNPYERRLKKPKYSNKFRESISREALKLKLNLKSLKTTLNKSNLVAVREVLKSNDFN